MHLSNDTGVTKRDRLNENEKVVREVNYYKSNVDATANITKENTKNQQK